MHYYRWRRQGDPLAVINQTRRGECAVEGCDQTVKAKRLCGIHYARQLATGDTGAPGRIRAEYRDLCSVDGCRQPHVAQGFCNNHYKSWQKYGDPLEATARRKRAALVCSVPGCERPRPTKGLVDRGGVKLCGMHQARMRKFGQLDLPVKVPKVTKGHINKDGYRIVSYDGRVLMEHRLIMEFMIGRPLLPEENVHHINGVKDDNRPENLELWSRSQPPGQRVLDKVAWAREIIDMYGSLVDGGVLT